MIHPENFEQKIGFNHIREDLKGHCISAMGLERAEAMGFSNDKEAIERSLDQTMEFVQLLQNGVPFPVRDYHDLREEFLHIKIPGTSISLEGLFAMKPSLTALSYILKFGQSESREDYPELCALTDGIEIDQIVFKEANRLVDDKGEIVGALQLINAQNENKEIIPFPVSDEDPEKGKETGGHEK